MYQLWYELIYRVLFNNNDVSILGAISYNFGEGSSAVNVSGAQYFSSLIALICTIIVYVIVCLCIYKVVKLIGRLFVRL